MKNLTKSGESMGLHPLPVSQQELEELHGLGKSAVARLKVLMNAKKIKFRP